MNHDDAAAPLRELLDIRPLLGSDVPGVLGVNDHHVARVELLGRRPILRAVDFRPALREQLRPVRQKTRVIVLIRAVGLDSARG